MEGKDLARVETLSKLFTRQSPSLPQLISLVNNENLNCNSLNDQLKKILVSTGKKTDFSYFPELPLTSIPFVNFAK